MITGRKALCFTPLEPGSIPVLIQMDVSGYQMPVRALRSSDGSGASVSPRGALGEVDS